MTNLPEPAEMTQDMREAITLPVSDLSTLQNVLNEHGVAIVTGVLDEKQVDEGISLFWDYLESLGTDISRHDTSTHDNTRWPPTFSTGILDNPLLSSGQSRVAWWGRVHCKRVFSALYNTDNLVTSFDAIGVFREKIQTKKDLWYHTDSTPTKHTADYSTQGILNLVDTTQDGGGGLVVLPYSHRILFDEITAKKDWAPLWGDTVFWNKYNMVIDDIPELRPVRVGAPAGSVILFHSSVVHCNMPRLHTSPTPSHLGRAVVYVCMAPRERVTDKKWKEKRIEAINSGHTTSHWPDRIEVKHPPRYPLKRDVCDGKMHEKGTVLRYDDLTEEMKDLV